MDDKELEKRLNQMERKVLKRIDDHYQQLTETLVEYLSARLPKTLITQEELAKYLKVAPSTLRKRDKSIYPSVPLPDKDGKPSDTVRYIKEDILPMLMHQVM